MTVLASPWFDMSHGNHSSNSKMLMVYSVGKTPEEAIRSFCETQGQTCEFDPEDILENGQNPIYQWGYYFKMGGTGMKAAGCYVPGGVVLTWWK